MISHAGCAAIHPQIRNLDDEQIRACAETGGLIGVTAAGYYLGGAPTPERFFRHIDHIVQLVGPQHAMIGLDYLEDAAWLRAFFQRRPSDWPGLGEGAWEPVEFFPPEMLPGLTQQMIDAGYDEASIRGVLGENFLSVCERVWK